ncbi:MAG TPA: bifunctional phosphopantothenoylcysteine decarboxylase/phosphopantothenate--cysteine ligase CoaBC [Pyrinomonadaceae bacterium]|nr:bifunctional phosphopantothenoylcysteine decarboxylase/phosphopantothenate--cysteine ligase CoaBC [Pyrinomonadaceae bacterium]
MGQSGSEISRPTKRIALGVCGGIAAYKAVEILRGLQQAGCEVRVAMTKRACEFIQPLTFRAISGHHVVVDDYAPDNPDPIAHITFSQTIDLLIVAPATANMIAKFALGIADDFISSTYLAASAPVVVAPAMNTKMWQHPATVRNVEQLRKDGVYVIEPDAGEMACGTFGPGRLSEPERIVNEALSIITGRSQDMRGEQILITVGATREAIDPVRFISNRSSGRMGFALAEAALERGADVTIVSGVTTAAPPPKAKLLTVETAQEMATAVDQELAGKSVFIASAAVVDYRPTQPANQKIKKKEQNLTLSLEKTPDILTHVSTHRQDGMLVIGFAAETENVLDNAREKLRSKNLDMIVANDVSRSDSGFDTQMNAITILTRNQHALELPLMSKREAADLILDVIVDLRKRQRSKHVTG